MNNMSNGSQGVSRKNKRKIDLYWKLEFLRNAIPSWLYRCAYKNEGKSYWLSILWNFVCGYSLMDSFYYDYRTWKCVKKIILKLKSKIII